MLRHKNVSHADTKGQNLGHEQVLNARVPSDCVHVCAHMRAYIVCMCVCGVRVCAVCVCVVCVHLQLH